MLSIVTHTLRNREFPYSPSRRFVRGIAKLTGKIATTALNIARMNGKVASG